MRVLLAGLLITTAAAVTACGGGFGLLGPDDGDSPEGTPQRTVLVAHDSSGNHHDGVIQGQPVLGLPGHRGTSYSFDIRGSWVEVPSTPALNPGRRAFSLSMWVNFGVAPRGMHTYDIVRKGLSYTRTGEYKLEIIHGGLVRCTTKDLDGDRARISARGHPVTDGRWHRVGCSRAGSSWTVHVDGWSATERDRLGAISNTMPLSIGSKYGLEDMPQGRVDEVRLRIGGRTVGLWHLDEKPAPAG